MIKFNYHNNQISKINAIDLDSIEIGKIPLFGKDGRINALGLRSNYIGEIPFLY